MRLPPSPPGAIPFLAHLHLIKKPFHATLSALAQRHGPVFTLRFGCRDAVVVTPPACARECFTEHDVTFANRSLLPSQRLVTFDGDALGTAKLRAALAQPPPHRRGAAPLGSPRRLHVGRHLRRGARHGAAAAPRDDDDRG